MSNQAFACTRMQETSKPADATWRRSEWNRYRHTWTSHGMFIQSFDFAHSLDCCLCVHVVALRVVQSNIFVKLVDIIIVIYGRFEWQYGMFEHVGELTILWTTARACYFGTSFSWRMIGQTGRFVIVVVVIVGKATSVVPREKGGSNWEKQERDGFESGHERQALLM